MNITSTTTPATHLWDVESTGPGLSGTPSMAKTPRRTDSDEGTPPKTMAKAPHLRRRASGSR
jgi:hypothetical protein